MAPTNSISIAASTNEYVIDALMPHFVYLPNCQGSHCGHRDFTWRDCASTKHGRRTTQWDNNLNEANTICIVDDDPSFLRALTRRLSLEGFRVESFTATDSFFEYTTNNMPACIVLDMSLPNMSGLQIQAELLDRDVDCPIVFLSGRSDVSMSVEAMKAGAFDFLTKPVDPAGLIDVVTAAVNSHSASVDTRHTLATLAERWASLTPREQEVCRRVVAGQLNKEIAVALGAAEKTIKVHRGRAMRKMGARRVADLVRMGEKILTACKTLV